MARYQVNTTPPDLVRRGAINPAEINPKARPNDVFVRPQETRVGVTGAQQLADNLDKLINPLNTYFKAKQKRQDDEAYNKGVRMAIENNYASWAEAVKANPELEKYNPYLREGVERVIAMRRGAEAQIKLAEMANNMPAEYTTPEQISQYADNCMQEIIQNYGYDINDRAVAEILVPNLQQASGRIWQAKGQEQQEKLVDEKYENYSATITSTLQNMKAENLSGAEIAKRIGALNNNFISAGSDPKRANDITIEALNLELSSVTTQEDLDRYSEAISNIAGVDGAKLSNITRYKSVYQRALQSAQNNIIQADNKAERDKRKADEERYYNNYASIVLKNPTADYSKQALKWANGDIETAEYFASKINRTVGLLGAEVATVKAGGSSSGGGRGASSGASNVSIADISPQLIRSYTHEDFSRNAAMSRLTREEIEVAFMHKWITKAKRESLIQNLYNGTQNSAANQRQARSKALANSLSSELGGVYDGNNRYIELEDADTKTGNSDKLYFINYARIIDDKAIDRIQKYKGTLDNIALDRIYENIRQEEKFRLNQLKQYNANKQAIADKAIDSGASKTYKVIYNVQSNTKTSAPKHERQRNPKQ